MKKWYKSRVLWLNIITLIASLLQWKYGLILPGEVQGMVLTILNIILRFETDRAIGTEKAAEEYNANLKEDCELDDK